MRDAGIDLALQVVDVLVDRRRLRVLFRIAGAVYLQLRPVLPNIGDQIAGVFEHSGRGLPLHAIAAQCEHTVHFGHFEQVESHVGCFPVQILGRQMGHGGDAVFAANRIRDARGRSAILGFAGAVGNGDECRSQPLQSIKRVVDGADGSVPTRRKHFQRKQRCGHSSFLLFTLIWQRLQPAMRAVAPRIGDACQCTVWEYRGAAPSVGTDGSGPTDYVRRCCAMAAVTWRAWRARSWLRRRGSRGSARSRRCRGSSNRSPG